MAENWLMVLDEVRALALNGLHHAENSHDRERYDRLLKLASGEFARLSGETDAWVKEKFLEEVGYVTPKVGVDAAIFDPEGKLLLTQRRDDRCWCLPCGWAEVGESAYDAAAREVFEETCVTVEVKSVIEVFSRFAGTHQQVFSSYHILFYCERIAGDPKSTPESAVSGYFHHEDVKPWHKDHLERVKAAYRFRTENIADGG